MPDLPTPASACSPHAPPRTTWQAAPHRSLQSYWGSLPAPPSEPLVLRGSPQVPKCATLTSTGSPWGPRQPAGREHGHRSSLGSRRPSPLGQDPGQAREDPGHGRHPRGWQGSTDPKGQLVLVFRGKTQPASPMPGSRGRTGAVCGHTDFRAGAEKGHALGTEAAFRDVAGILESPARVVGKVVAGCDFLGEPGGSGWAQEGGQCIPDAGIAAPVAVGGVGRATGLVHFTSRAGKGCVAEMQHLRPRALARRRPPGPAPLVWPSWQGLLGPQVPAGGLCPTLVFQPGPSPDTTPSSPGTLCTLPGPSPPHSRKPNP